MPENKDFFYNTIADSFENTANPYDTDRRREVIFDDFLRGVDLKGRLLLDGGCGFGAMTAAALQRGAVVTAIDIADRLVGRVNVKMPGVIAVQGSVLALPFADGTFDVVVSSDVIEHTEQPFKAVDELIRVLKPGGLLCLTVPNRTFWFFSVVCADKFGWRRYKGHENWVHYGALRRYLIAREMTVLEYKGVHLFPFVVPALNGFLRQCDRFLDKSLGLMMVNIACYARKREKLL